MIKYLIGASFLAIFAFAESSTVQAQQSTVVATCGAESIPTSQGTSGTFIAADGSLCTSGSGGGGSNAAAGPTGSAVPADGSYNALNVGGTLRGQTGVNPSGTIYAAQVVDLSAGLSGATAPTYATLIGSLDGSGNLQPNSVSNPAFFTASSLPLPTGAATAANQATMISSLATIVTNTGSAIPAGTATIGGTFIVPHTSGGLTVSTFEPGASDNHTNLKNGAGQLYWVTAFNNSATINYLRFYNAATGFNGCNSATNLVLVVHIPANTSDAGFLLHVPEGIPFSTGISYCVVSAYGQTTTTNATASAMDVNIGYN